jgi:hypothetical protein
MPTCVFKSDEVRRCVEHALNSTQWSMGWMEELQPVPGLFFVHDEGVYLMSNGEPRDVVAVMSKAATTYVAYAEHCNPKVDEDWWDNSRELVGGDDFAEVLPINQDWLAKLGRYEELEITVDGAEISWKFVKPKRIVRVV